jgi:hypothetical protein
VLKKGSAQVALQRAVWSHGSLRARQQRPPTPRPRRDGARLHHRGQWRPYPRLRRRLQRPWRRCRARWGGQRRRKRCTTVQHPRAAGCALCNAAHAQPVAGCAMCNCGRLAGLYNVVQTRDCTGPFESLPQSAVPRRRDDSLTPLTTYSAQLTQSQPSDQAHLNWMSVSSNLSCSLAGWAGFKRG